MNSYHPACCSLLDDHDPLPLPLAGGHLLSTRFDPLLLADDDFDRCAIPAVRGVAKRRTEHLAGRLCAREALRRLTGTAQVPAVGEDRAPQWPAGVVGSITHGDGWAAALVARASHWRAVGLDVEHLLAVERALALQAQLLTTDEIQRLQGLGDLARAQRISLTFSMKESLFKALYPLTLTRFYFQDAEMLDCDSQQARLRLLVDLDDDWPAGSEVQGQYALFDNRVLSLVTVPA